MMSDKENRENIERQLYMHGKLSILFYRSNDLFIIRKFGVYESLEIEYEKLLTKFKKASFIEEYSSTTLMELPNDVDEIFKIIHCGGLQTFLNKNNINI